MSQSPDPWASRRRRWHVERLDPARTRAPERRHPFVTLGDIAVDGLYGPWSLETGPDGEHRVMVLLAADLGDAKVAEAAEAFAKP